MIYLDHAATSWPKPPDVLAAMADYLERAGGNPGRSGHALSIEAGRIVYETRELLATFFNAPDPMRVIFLPNVTYALNLALLGLLHPGDRVVTSGIEHNAMMRPLRALERHGVTVTVVPSAPDGTLNLDNVRAALREAPTRLVALNHASNVMGTINPAQEVAQAAHEAGALLLLDAAQTAGCLPIDVQTLGVDLLAFTGHKGLQGPPGTGGLVLAPSFDEATLEPLVRGGTGSRSEFEEQPDMLPDKYEGGTPNGVGIAGLGAGLRFLMERSVESIREHELDLTSLLLEGLSDIPGVTLYGPRDPARRTAVVSFTATSHNVSQIGFWLDEEYGILCRVGLHCAPAAHKTISTFPEGTVRLAAGVFNTTDEIEQAIRAVRAVVSS
jgi:cysteine desulfurase family protein